MNYKSLQKYIAPLPFPQKVGEIETIEKQGAILNFEYKGREITGDLSPFPGFSLYQLDEILELFKKEWEKDELQSTTNPHLEFLRYQLESQKLNTNPIFPKIFSNKLCRALDLQQLETEEKSLKIKTRTEEDRDAVLKYVKQYKGPPQKIRIDSNGQWERMELLNFYQDLNSLLSKKENLSLDYFEEPLKNYEDYQRLGDILPFTLEENLLRFLEYPQGISPVGFVIKPSQQGISVTNTLKRLNKRIILSSAFEIPISLFSLNLLASELPDEIHGLSAKIDKEKLKLI